MDQKMETPPMGVGGAILEPNNQYQQPENNSVILSRRQLDDRQNGFSGRKSGGRS